MGVEPSAVKTKICAGSMEKARLDLPCRATSAAGILMRHGSSMPLNNTRELSIASPRKRAVEDEAFGADPVGRQGESLGPDHHQDRRRPRRWPLARNCPNGVSARPLHDPPVISFMSLKKRAASASTGS